MMEKMMVTVSRKMGAQEEDKEQEGGRIVEEGSG